MRGIFFIGYFVALHITVRQEVLQVIVSATVAERGVRDR